MVEIGFRNLKSDACVYIYSGSGAIYMLTLHADDIPRLGKDRKELECIKVNPMRRFSMTDMGNVTLVLGMKGDCYHWTGKQR